MATSASSIANESVLTMAFAKASATRVIASLHPDQRTPVEFLLNGRDIFATFPAGRKSAIFQDLPIVMHELRTTGVNLFAKHPIVSPLKSLMKGQVTHLLSSGKIILLHTKDKWVEQWLLSNYLVRLTDQ